MLYCPECGSELEPGDEFCINCGASLLEGGDNTPAAKKPKKRFNPVPLVIILGVIVLIAAAALAAFSTPELRLMTAVSKTSNDLKKNPTYAELEKLASGGSINAEANLTEFLSDLHYLDDVDAKANAKVFFDPENSRIVTKLGASVSGLSALDADFWIDGESLTVKSGAFLGKDAYTIDLKPFYADPDAVAASKAFSKAVSASKNTAFLKLYRAAVKHGTLTRDKGDEETVYHLSIDASAAEKILHDFYAWARKDKAVKAFFEDVDPSSVYAFIDSIDNDFNLKLRFFVHANDRITRLEVKTNTAFVSAGVDDPEEISLVELKIKSGEYDLKYDSAIDDSADTFGANVSCKSDGKEFAKLLIDWDKKDGDFEIRYDNTRLTPAMKLYVDETDKAEDVPDTAATISLDDEKDVRKLAGAVSENVNALIDELGLFLPFSLEDMVSETLTGAAESYKGFIGSNERPLSISEITAIAQEAAQAKADERAREVAEATAREIAEAKAVELEAKVDAKIREIEEKNRALITAGGPVISAGTDGAGTETDPSGKKDYKATIPGTYEYNADGINATVALGADGQYAMKVKYAFFNIQDTGSYSVDDNGSVTFNTKLNYNVTGKYDGADSLTVTIDGLDSATLTRK